VTCIVSLSILLLRVIMLRESITIVGYNINWGGIANSVIQAVAIIVYAANRLMDLFCFGW